MRYQVLLLSVVIALSPSCKKESSPANGSLKANAEIIGFKSEKCGCCWGWVIRMGTDTIKVDSLPNVSAVGYDISSPIPIYLELAGVKQDCSAMPAGDPVVTKNYYVIKKLEIIQ